MAKGKNDPGGNDYLEQLQWRSKYRRRWPIRHEPKWKYKIVYRYPHITPFDRFLRLVIVLAVTFIIYQFSSVVMTNAVWEIKVFFGAVLGMIILIIFFAIQDVSKDSHHKSDQ